MIDRSTVEEVLAAIRPALQRDGGDVTLVDVGEDNVVRVRLMGRCKGCAMSQMTLKQGIEARLKQAIPEVKAVESV